MGSRETDRHGMGASKPIWIALLVLGFCLSGSALAQNTGQTVRHHKIVEQDSSFPPSSQKPRAQSRNADYASAEPLLKKVVAADPRRTFRPGLTWDSSTTAWGTPKSPLLHTVNRCGQARRFRVQPESGSDAGEEWPIGCRAIFARRDDAKAYRQRRPRPREGMVISGSCA